MTTPGKIIRNQIQSLTRKHTEIESPKQWLGYIYDTFDVGARVKIASTHKFTFQSAIVFIISPYGQIITPSVAALAAGLNHDEAIYISDETIDLERALQCWDDPNTSLYLCLSKDFKDNASSNESTLVLKWNKARTVYTQCTLFKTTVAKLVNTRLFDSPHRTSEHSLPPNLLHILHQNHDNHTEAVSSLLTKFQLVLKTATTAESRVDETNQKLGYLNEEVWRQKLANEEGLSWATSFQFDSLRELVEWVGTKVKVNRVMKAKALQRIVNYCIGRFNGFHHTEGEMWNEVSNSPEIILIY